MLGLGGFIAVDLGVLVWFGWTAYRLVAGLLQGSGDEQAFRLWGVAAGATFLAVFIAKALVFNKRAERDTRALELTPAEQPALLAFLCTSWPPMPAYRARTRCTCRRRSMPGCSATCR
ncbi:putative membrane-associated peptidase [Xanthomonas oryzae pv. oryzicola BLS256]|uniref:Putative membrane-associated peptidase n=1 Tax=Xanthomonas oryzae pv. oryzicola (strain BLS256) TaxID=383407 RepID=G7TJN0_XANOB|nr:putative membrane-associated peptidase [Xanthomonas oryzae pv. oryzicola BLS256]